MSPDLLLEDQWVIHFINHGWLNMRFGFTPGFHENIHQRLSQMTDNPGNRLLEEVPELAEVVSHPGVQGVLQSLLGTNHELHPRRYFYNNLPGSQSQGWHVDAATPDHMLRSLILFYYPHDVDLEMGPTILVPGTHFRNAPMDRMTSYANIRGQKNFVGQAGTMAVLHPDLWHARSLNRSSTPRYMIKFMFTRPDPPTAPTWRHDPETAPGLFLSKVREFVGPTQAFCSDYLAEWEWRRRLWNWLRGAPVQAPNLMDFLV